MQTNVETLTAFAEDKTAAKYANRIIEHVGPPPNLVCSLCDKPDSAMWRCDSCQKNRDLCTPCLRNSHMANPFHRVRYFTPTQYREAWLRDAGVFIQLCPKAKGTSLCSGYDSKSHVLPSDIDSKAPPLYGSASLATPSKTARGHPAEPGAAPRGLADPQDGSAEPRNRPGSTTLSEELPLADYLDDGMWPPPLEPEQMDEGEAEANLLDADASDSDAALDELEGTVRKRGRDATVRKDVWGYPVMVIVHEIDIHQLGIAYCKCEAGGRDMPRDEQLLALGGLFPATQKEPNTCFSLRGLAYHQVDRLECKVAPEAIMRKLRRQTSPMHYATVPVRFDEYSGLHSAYAV